MSLFSPVRRRLLGGLLAGCVMPALATSEKITVDVWKDPNCGCCQDWITYLEREGFAVRVFNQGNQAARQRLGLPERYGSCHTAKVGDYVVEGHVPAADIRRLLREKPKALGIAAPGMPVGAPGMDGPAYGGRRDAYDVLLVNLDGSSRVFASHR
ncbi:DUF411 domain-containing protein [Dechloromonas sp. ZY10]|uniref:DUF411 domain-containing protein n=1 Tax=Dechloromonas aquae TaxID=2664436 RepID=UPI003528976D